MIGGGVDSEADAGIDAAMAVINAALRQRKDATPFAVGLLTVAVGSLVMIGGRQATVTTLQGLIFRIQAGHYPEPAHRPGSA